MRQPPPPPITALTYEQQFEMAKMIKLAKQLDKEELISAFVGLMTHNYCLKNTVSNLLIHWADDDIGTDDRGTGPD